MKSIKPCVSRYIPKLNIMIPDITVKLCLGRLFAIHCPISTPRRLVEIKASAAPTKSAGPKTPPKKPKDMQAAVTTIFAKKIISRK